MAPLLLYGQLRHTLSVNHQTCNKYIVCACYSSVLREVVVEDKRKMQNCFSFRTLLVTQGRSYGWGFPTNSRRGSIAFMISSIVTKIICSCPSFEYHYGFFFGSSYEVYYCDTSISMAPHLLMGYEHRKSTARTTIVFTRRHGRTRSERHGNARGRPQVTSIQHSLIRSSSTSHPWASHHMKAGAPQQNCIAISVNSFPQT